MSRSNSPSSSAHASAPKTVDEALGPLTQKAVDDAADALNKKFLTEARGIALGMATLLIGPNDKQDQAVLDLLAEANVGKGDLQQLVSLGGALITAAADRDAAEAATKAATLKLEGRAHQAPRRQHQLLQPRPGEAGGPVVGPGQVRDQVHRRPQGHEAGSEEGRGGVERLRVHPERLGLDPEELRGCPRRLGRR